MKRMLMRFISVCLILSVLLSVVDLHVSATSLTYKTCVAHHFDKLGGNVPRNVKGSCGFVALSLFLMFYNIYWNENIVLEEFEDHNVVNCNPYSFSNASPQLAIENEFLPTNEDGTSISTEQYRTFIEENKTNYLHMYLLFLASLDIENDGEPILNLNDENYTLTTRELKTLLEYYLYNICNVDPRGVTVHTEYSYGLITSESNSLFVQSIIDKVKGNGEDGVNSKGIPVIIRGTDPASGTTPETKTGHFMIAYDVVNKKNSDGTEYEDLVLHACYESEYEYSLLTTDYKLNVDILWIEVNEDYFSHVCCDNYLWYPTQTYVCSCEAYKDLHPEHTHENSGVYVSRDAEGHVYECVWGDTSKEPHKRASSSSVSDTIHESTCRCGYKFTEAHRYTSYQIISNSLHYKVCGCGYKYSENHIFVKQSAQYSICTECGYRRDHFGGNENVHLGTEEDEETE
ncbi:MAG: hypothetical protein IJW02_03570 [Clostridia bacterium]|nr:hypothetical protein [Clostridia bacterium]